MQELIKRLREEQRIVGLETFDVAVDLIESQAAEIEKYKALCDQMGTALEVSSPLYREHDIDWHEALEAWRAMK